MTDPIDLGLSLPVRGIQLIEASAGTGKTFTVATLYARLVIEFGLPVPRLLAVTFTEAATQDLREQLRKRLLQARQLLEHPAAPLSLAASDGDGAETLLGKQLLRDAVDREGIAPLLLRLRRAVEQMDIAPIHTIHAFCQRALNEHALEAGQPLAARELLANEAQLRHEVALEFWRRQSLDRRSAQALLAVWNSPSQLASSLRDLLALDAITPSASLDRGDEVELALRGARGLLAVTFDAHGDSARELLRQACAAKEVNATYSRDSAVDPVWAALRAWRHDPLDSDPPTEKLGNYRRSFLAGKTNARKATPQSPLFDAIETWADATQAGEVALHERKIAIVHAARDFASARIEALKHERGVIGFDDMIRGVAHALEQDSNGRFAAALQAQYAIALVDEFQDTDPRQWSIFRRLFAAPAAADGEVPRALFLIGDPKQAIYRFRGGDVATYLSAQDEAEQRHPLPTNFRSRPLALAAVQAVFQISGDGAFDQPGIEFETVASGGTCPDDALRIDNEDAPGLVFQWLQSDPLDESIEAAREQATAACVFAIHDLLAKGQAGRASLLDRDGRQRPLAPRDITVLVPRNEDAARIQRALSVLGIPSVAAGRSSLYETEEAAHLSWLLHALLAPADDGRMRTVLASPLFGWVAADIAALDTDLPRHRSWQDRFHGWQLRARKHGPMAVVGEICAEQAPRLLAWPDGERRLSNYLQLAEDLQAADSRALGLGGLLSELERRIDQADDRNDAELLRLESDATRVRIMTLHVSKGLTLDVVFLPYAATIGSKLHPSVPPMARFHDGLSRVGQLFATKADAACREDIRENRGEHIRLLYVGLTRARLCTWVGWGALKDAHKTALGWLLHRNVGDSPPGDMDVARFDDAAGYARLQAVQALAPGAITIADPVDAAAVAGLVRLHFTEAGSVCPARIARRQIDRDWWVYSFSQLSREDSGGDERGADDEIEAVPLLRSRFSGSRFGNALHQALERVDFPVWRDWTDALPPTGQLEAVAEALRDWGYSSDLDQEEGLPLLTQLVSETLNASMPEGTRLALLTPSQRCIEMEFHLALAPFSVDAWLRLLHAHGLLPDRQAFGLRQRLEGLLTGRIDLVYEAGGRFYVLDYKSNQLPGYGSQAVALAIREGEYDLQYLLYTLALHRWLRFRLGAGYDIDQHLGGVRYVFCRGLDRHDATRPGLHALRLPTALVLAVDALMAST